MRRWLSLSKPIHQARGFTIAEPVEAGDMGAGTVQRLLLFLRKLRAIALAVRFAQTGGAVVVPARGVYLYRKSVRVILVYGGTAFALCVFVREPMTGG